MLPNVAVIVQVCLALDQGLQAIANPSLADNAMEDLMGK